jgi:hypothetical protein
LVNENSTLPWDTAITDLTAPDGIYSYPTSPLQFSKGLSEACVPMVLDSGPCKYGNYDSTDGTDYWSRASMYTTYNELSPTWTASMYFDDYKEVVAQLIVNDNPFDPPRSLRAFMFNRNYTHVGVCCGCHGLYADMCGIQFAFGLVDFAPAVNTIIPRPSPISTPSTCAPQAVSSVQTPSSDRVLPSNATVQNDTYQRMTMDLYYKISALYGVEWSNALSMATLEFVNDYGLTDGSPSKPNIFYTARNKYAKALCYFAPFQTNPLQYLYTHNMND